MDCDVVCSRLHERLDITAWFGQHQMHVKGQFTALSDAGHDAWSHGKIRNKMTVHDIYVQQIRTTGLDTLYRFAQTAEIRRENRRGDQAVMSEFHLTQ